MSASTVQAQVRLGALAIAELRELERDARAERARMAERRAAERTAEYRERGVAEAAARGSLAGRVEALEGCLPRVEVECAREEIAAAPGAGALSAFGSRVEALEREAERRFAVGASQRLAAETLARRTGSRIEARHGEPGARLESTLETGRGERMTFSVTALPAEQGGQLGAEQLVSFHTANSNIDDRVAPEGAVSACERQWQAVERLADAYGDEMTLEDPPLGGAAAVPETGGARSAGAG